MFTLALLRLPPTATIEIQYFFFQAEDGIRDHCVTGVQTCALPISLGRRSRAATQPRVFDGRRVTDGRTLCRRRCRTNESQEAARSEERRVGKECRSRWS